MCYFLLKIVIINTNSFKEYIHMGNASQTEKENYLNCVNKNLFDGTTLQDKGGDDALPADHSFWKDFD